VIREAPERQHTTAPAALLSVLILLGLALRFYRLGQWSFDSDEVFMLRDSLHPDILNPRPLLYLLNHYVVRPLIPLNELGLRLLPAIFGVLAIPVFYFICRRLLNTRTALFGTFLLTVSPLLVYYSQFARYWSLVFLLCCIYPYAIYIAIRDRSSRFLLLGIVTAVLAVLAHPASILLIGGFGIWAFSTYVSRERIGEFWGRRSVQWGTLAVVVVALIAGWRMVRLLHGWIAEHDTHPGGSEFLLGVPATPGLKQVLYLLGFAESLTFLLVLTAILGLYLLWRSDRPLALLLTSMAVFPLVFLVLISFRTPVSTFYLVPTLPIAFMGAGFFLDRLAALNWELRPGWLLPVLLSVIILGEGAPTLVSQYRDGRRYDFRGAARWVDESSESADVVFSDQYKVVTHYLPGKQVRRLLGDPTPLMQAARGLHQNGGNALWVVTPAPSHAFRTNPKLGSLNRWIFDNCQLRTILGTSRLDFRQNLLQIYRCPPISPDASTPEPSTAASSGKPETSARPAGR
jgi:mannosyltransferase